ncbi:MAG: hypothetical protein M0P12_00550 [Paludibacteraceae bacterium]|nr:hypothetical protein [Paludibacteraceae bacterium]MCK9615810.1 hypothetical protein [Candidatus Omnitrophota bacterium]
MKYKLTAKEFALRRIDNLFVYLGIDKENFLKENGFKTIESKTGFDFVKMMCLVSEKLDIDVDYFFDRFRLEKGEAKWTFKK